VIKPWKAENWNDARYSKNCTGLLGLFNKARLIRSIDITDVEDYLRSFREKGIGTDIDFANDPAVLALAFFQRAYNLERSSRIHIPTLVTELKELSESWNEIYLDMAIEAAFDLLFNKDQVWLSRIKNSPLYSHAFVIHDDHLYRYDVFEMERRVANKLLCLALGAPSNQEILKGVEKLARDIVFPANGERDYGEQRNAAVKGATQKLTIITGGPGTGKTTTLAGLLALWVEKQRLSRKEPTYKIRLTAPTGRAVSQMASSFKAEIDEMAKLPDNIDRILRENVNGKTIHKLLDYSPGEKPEFNRHNQITDDIIIVDEASMMSLQQMDYLLSALGPDTQLVLVGDKDQLPSIEAGTVFLDIVEGFSHDDSPIDIMRLNKAHRFVPELKTLIDAIRDGRADTAVRAAELVVRPRCESVDETMEPKIRNIRERVIKQAVDICIAAKKGNKTIALSKVKELLVICARKNDDPLSVEDWNQTVLKRLSEKKLGPADPNHSGEWYPGRPIVIGDNCRIGDRELSNGDIGVTIWDGNHLKVVFSDELEFDIAQLAEPPRYRSSNKKRVETMYAMTVHKSQGSQVESAVVVLPASGPLLNRQLLYTGVTRAKKSVEIIGSKDSVIHAVNHPIERETGLAAHIQQSIQTYIEYLEDMALPVSDHPDSEYPGYDPY